MKKAEPIRNALMIDLERMRRIIGESYETQIQHLSGGDGVLALRGVINSVSVLVNKARIEKRDQPLYVIQRLVSNGDFETDVMADFEKVNTVKNYDDLLIALDTVVIYEVMGWDNFTVWDGADINPEILSRNAIVYKYENGVECFYANGQRVSVASLQVNSASFFSKATFMDLDEALQRYKEEEARMSACYVLNEVWLDDKRILLKPKPEALMRKSLEQYLRRHIRDGDVRPEHNVNETEPVDIKVTWDYSMDRALIEIKWLGKCGQTTTCYTAGRARKGAGQLVNYLEEEKVRSSNKYENLGYLVVIDARRRCVNNDTTEVSIENGMHFAEQEIEYDPAFHETRDDFKKPVRMFVEPKCQS